MGTEVVTAPLAEHEEMDRWKRLPVWAQQELEKWRVDEAHQRGRAEVAETRLDQPLPIPRPAGVTLTREQYESLLHSHGAGPVWCTACEGSGRQIYSVGGTRSASDHPCQQCAGLGKHLPR